MLSINTYDEFGKPGASNLGRFQYTGQRWLPELGLYDYKARMYAPALGRFLQTDPIGYGSGPNIYAYVRGDPVNLSDPSGLDCAPAEPGGILVCGSSGGGTIGGGYGAGGGGGSVGYEPEAGKPEAAKYGPPIFVTGTRLKPKPLRILMLLTKGSQEPGYCSSFLYKASRGSQKVGENLSNYASGAIAAGLIGKVPQVVEAGEAVGAFGLVFQSLGALGKYVVSGNTDLARLDAMGVVSSFLKTQTKAAQIASGYAMNGAIATAVEVGHVEPCS